MSDISLFMIVSALVCITTAITKQWTGFCVSLAFLFISVVVFLLRAM